MGQREVKQGKDKVGQKQGKGKEGDSGRIQCDDPHHRLGHLILTVILTLALTLIVKICTVGYAT